jgi:hypothetical protein
MYAPSAAQIIQIKKQPSAQNAAGDSMAALTIRPAPPI